MKNSVIYGSNFHNHKRPEFSLTIFLPSSYFVDDAFGVRVLAGDVVAVAAVVVVGVVVEAAW